MSKTETKLKHYLVFRRLGGPGGRGGLDVLFFDWLARVDFSRCRITFVVPPQAVATYVEKFRQKGWPVGVAEYAYMAENVSGWQKFWKLFQFLKNFKPSGVIFLQGAFTDFGLAHVLAASLLTGGHVFMHENLGAPEPPVKPGKNYFGIIPALEMWWHKTRVLKNWRGLLTRRILVVSSDIRNTLVNDWGYPASKVEVAYHGVNVRRFTPSVEISRQMRADLGIPAGDIILISTARFSAIKCLDRLIDAFDTLYRDHKNIWLLMLGGGSLEADLKARASRLPSTERIKFVGEVSDVSLYLKMSDIFVLPSDNEGLSLALMEAMATGLICVSTKTTGSGDAIEDGINGFRVDKNTEAVTEGLRKVVDLPDEQRKAMSRAATERAREKFDVISRVRDILKTLELPALPEKSAPELERVS